MTSCGMYYYIYSQKKCDKIALFQKLEENKKNEVIEDGKDCNRYRQ